MRRRTAVLLVAAFAAVAGTAAAAGVRLAASTDGYKAVIVGVRPGAGDRELIAVVEMTGCERLGRVDVRERPDAVRLAVYVRGAAGCGTITGTPHDVRVMLAASLGARTVLDAGTGTPLARTDG